MFQKILMTTVLMTGILAGTSQVLAAGGICGGSPTPTPPTLQSIDWSGMGQNYMNYYSRCGSAIGELNQASARAKLYIKSGSIDKAAKVLIDTLIAKAATLPSSDFDMAYPVTMESIRQSAEIAQTIKTATQAVQAPAVMKAQIQYMTVSRLYNIIGYAYSNLDTPYYQSSIGHCYHGGCYDNQLPDMFGAYYQGVTELARMLLNVQQSQGTAQGLDDIEISMTAAVAKATRLVLQSSLFGRSYSCAIMDLYAIQMDAEEFTCQNPGYNQATFVDDLRSRLANVYIPSNHGCGQY